MIRDQSTSILIKVLIQHSKILQSVPIPDLCFTIVSKITLQAHTLLFAALTELYTKNSQTTVPKYSVVKSKTAYYQTAMEFNDKQNSAMTSANEKQVVTMSVSTSSLVFKKLFRLSIFLLLFKIPKICCSVNSNET